MAKKYQYIVDLKADTSKFKKSAGGIGNMLKPAAMAAGALFAADKIKDAAVAVYNFGEEIDGVRTNVQKLTGLSGGALNSVTGEVKAIADVYKKDYEQVLQSGNALAKQFGITNSKALGLIKSGFVAGADASGDMLNQLKEYSTQFKAAGYNASEMLAIISQTEKMGLFSDKGVDTIKEGTIRLREMTATTREAMDNIGLSSRKIEEGLADGTYKVNDVIKMVSARLGELPPTSAKVGTAIADIFGGAGEDAGLDFILMLKDLNLNLQELEENASDQSKANKALVDAQKELNATAAAMFGGMNESMVKAKTLMYDFINDSLKYGVELVNWFIDLYNESVIFRASIEYVGMTFKNLWQTVKTVFKYIWNAIKTTGQALGDLITFDFTSFKKRIKKGFNDALGIATEWGENVSGNIKNAVENTLERDPIEYVSLDVAEEQAENAGEASAEAFAKGLTSKPIALPPIDLDKVSFSGEADLPSLGEDLFAAGTSSGNKNRLSAMLAEVNGEFEKASNYAALYGDSLSLYTDKQNILSDSIKTLIDEGYSPQGEAIQALITMQDELAEKQGENAERMQLMQTFSTDLGNSLMNTAKQGAESFAEMGSNLLNTARQVISSHIATGVAAALASSFESVPFPFNVIGAPVAAAMATTAFNSLVPKFADGGMVYGPTMGLMGEYPGARSNPEVIAPLDKLRGILRNDSSPQGGQVEFEIKGDRLVGVLNNHNRRTSRQR